MYSNLESIISVLFCFVTVNKHKFSSFIQSHTNSEIIASYHLLVDSDYLYNNNSFAHTACCIEAGFTLNVLERSGNFFAICGILLICFYSLSVLIKLDMFPEISSTAWVISSRSVTGLITFYNFILYSVLSFAFYIILTILC